MYEKGLVDILKDLVNIPMFKSQNGWSPEGWRTITQKFNEKFPLAHFTKQQVQEKEREFKSSYKTIRDARAYSGAGWDESLGMLIAEPVIWAKLIEDIPKVSKFKKKPFPLFNDCALLYDGSVATGVLNFTSTEPLPERSNSEQSTPNRTISSESLGINFAGTNPLEGIEVQSTPSNLNTGDQECSRGRKRKQSQGGSPTC